MKFNYVRIVTLFLLLASVGVFTSCSSLTGDDTDNNANSAYAGNWRLVKATFLGEVPDASEYAGFSIDLNSTGTYNLTNPTGFPSPTAGLSGSYQTNGNFLIFDGDIEVNVTSINGNTMTWEWQMVKPGKASSTNRYTFQRI